MKSLFRIFTLSILLLSISCGSSNSTGNNYYEDPHSKMHSSMHNEYYQEQVQKELDKQMAKVIGNYDGVGPCSDCEGIRIQLELLPGLTYKSTVTYLGKTNPPLIKSGGYKFNGNGIIQLVPPSGNVSFLVKISDGLMIVDKDGKEIKSASGGAHVLKTVEKKKVKTFDSTDARALDLKKKWDDGLRFYAKDSEATWSLHIYNSDSLRLESSKGLIYYGPISGHVPSIDPSVINYRIVLEEGDIMVQMIESSCEKENSNFSNSFEVKIELNFKSDDRNELLSGCGEFIPDPLLSGNWQIVKVDDQEIDADVFKNKIPELSLDLINASYSGNDGCNLFQGKAKFRDETIIFGPSMATLMACPNMDLSNKITKSYSEKVLSYTLDEYLIFYDGEKQLLKLKHME